MIFETESVIERAPWYGGAFRSAWQKWGLKGMITFSASGMTVEHEHMTSLLATIRYRVRSRHIHANIELTALIDQIRKKLLQEIEFLGPFGLGYISLRLRHSIERILQVTEPEHTLFRWGIKDIERAVKDIDDACNIALTMPRLSTLSSKTWSEQLAGRAAIMAKMEWPNLRDYSY